MLSVWCERHHKCIHILCCWIVTKCVKVWGLLFQKYDNNLIKFHRQMLRFNYLRSQLARIWTIYKTMFLGFFKNVSTFPNKECCITKTHYHKLQKLHKCKRSTWPRRASTSRWHQVAKKRHNPHNSALDSNHFFQFVLYYNLILGLHVKPFFTLLKDITIMHWDCCCVCGSAVQDQTCGPPISKAGIFTVKGPGKGFNVQEQKL